MPFAVIAVVLLLVLAGAAALFRLMRRVATTGAPGALGSSSSARDPFTLGEPWRQFVQSANSSRLRFQDTIAKAPKGPTSDRLHEIASQIEAAADSVWATAQQGHQLSQARRQIETQGLAARLADARAAAAAKDPLSTNDTADRTVSSLEAQLASAGRMDEVIQSSTAQLKLLQAQLEESIARAAEVSAATADSGSLSQLGSDVDHLVDDLEALRQAIAETSRLGGTST